MIPREERPVLTPKPLTLSKVLIVEGRDDEEFFEALLQHLTLSDQVEIRKPDGIHRLGDYLETLIASPEFTRVTAVGIVRDADADAAAAFRSVSDLVIRLGFNAPERPGAFTDSEPKIGAFILPDGVNVGSLEDLCLQAIKSDAAMGCVNRYFLCLRRSGITPGHLAKAKVRVYIASKQAPTLPLGIAAYKDYWNWDSPVFDSLKQFLQAF